MNIKYDNHVNVRINDKRYIFPRIEPESELENKLIYKLAIIFNEGNLDKYQVSFLIEYKFGINYHHIMSLDDPEILTMCNEFVRHNGLDRIYKIIGGLYEIQGIDLEKVKSLIDQLDIHTLKIDCTKIGFFSLKLDLARYINEDPEIFIYYLHCIFHSEDKYKLKNGEDSIYKRKLKYYAIISVIENIYSVKEAAKIFHRDNINKPEGIMSVNDAFRYIEKQSKYMTKQTTKQTSIVDQYEHDI